MSKAGEAASLLAVHLIEEQLQVLPISIAVILQRTQAGGVASGPDTSLMQLPRKRRPFKTGSVGNIVVDNAQAEIALDFDAAHQTLNKNPLQKNSYLRVIISNALLAVGVFLKEHNMAAMRTPEIQFMEHVVTAILNANTFKIEAGYMPLATFDGLVIDNSLHGSLLFGDGVREGLMEFGDAVALLQWLARYLGGEQSFVSGGDAG